MFYQRSQNPFRLYSGAAVFLLLLALLISAGSMSGQTLLSQNQPVTVSTYQTGNYPTNGNDGNLTTRWAASVNTFPQWWQVDLGTTNRISQAVVAWYTNSSTPRSYQYQILTSIDGVNFSVLVNNTNNAVIGTTTNNFSTLARYVQVNVTGSSYSAAYASLFECQIYGGPMPYTPDANTLVLFHLDEASGSVTTNAGSLGGSAYTVSESVAATVPPVVTDVLGNSSLTSFSNAASCGTGELIGWDYNNNGRYDGDASAAQLSADRLSMSLLNMGNGGQTPWTLEALIQPVTTNVNQEIICTDSSSTSARGFQFRINTGGQLELNLIAAGIDLTNAIPSTGYHAFVSGNWYHVAAAYDGTNVIMYWTKVDPSITTANAISTNLAAIGAAFGSVQGPLTVGNENRNVSGENFQGLIDEVRISNIARPANQMFFSSGATNAAFASLSATVITPANPVYAGTPVTLSAILSGTNATGYAWQSDGGTGGIVWTNLLNSITNTYTLATTGLTAGNYQYWLVVSTSGASMTNVPATLNLLAASGPILVTNTAINPSAALVGAPVSMSASFTGSQPIYYQWYFTNSSGVTLIAGATNSTYTISRAQTGNTGGYFLMASNNPSRLGSQTLASTPASLVVSPIYKSSSGMFCDLLEHPEETTISAVAPVFGWVYSPSFRNDRQTAYRIIVASSLSLANAGTGDLWDSGVVASSNSLNVTYGGAALQTSSSYYWRVQTVNSLGRTNSFSAVQQFNTAGTLSNPLTTGGVVYQQPGSGSVNCYPLRYVPVAPVLVATNSLGHWYIDFGSDAFGYATVHLNGNFSGSTVSFGLGELAGGNIVNTSPGATIRYQSGSYPLQNGDTVYTNRSSYTGSWAVSPPTGTYGIVSPFRYLELSGVPAGVTLTTNDVTQWRLQTEVDPTAASFNSSSPTLNQVWNLCSYSMQALTFDGIYVDGDRERTPYEADTYIHQLSAYGTFNDFTTPRCSFEYLTNHLTWPTEWPMHMIFVAWADYQQTGDPYLMTKYYGFLTNKCMYLSNARANGLLWSYPQTGNNHATTPSDIIDWYRVSGDGVGNVDGYVAEGTNAVINAFYFRCLTIMTNIATLTGHAADAATFATRAGQVASSFDTAFWNSGSYVDGVGTVHSSADANFYPLAFGLVPGGKQAATVNYLHSRIGALGAMPAGVYGAQYLLEGLFLAGDADTAIGLMATNNARSWMAMINSGSTISGEAWSTTDKNNEDWNHAWGAAPGNLIPRYVLGVRPLTAGYGQMLIQPHLGSTLSFVQGTVPTIRGPVSVFATNVAGQCQLVVNIPGNVIATVMLPATNTTGIIDGTVVTGTLSTDSLTNSWLTLTNIGAGQHAIWTSSTNSPNTNTLYGNWINSWLGTNAANAGQTADPDGDGMNNYYEFVAGTNPLDPTDYFHIAGTSYTPGSPFALTVNGHAGRHYSLQHSQALAPASWATVDTQTAAADNQTITLHDSAIAGATSTFFRVMVAYP